MKLLTHFLILEHAIFHQAPFSELAAVCVFVAFINNHSLAVRNARVRKDQPITVKKRYLLILSKC